MKRVLLMAIMATGLLFAENTETNTTATQDTMQHLEASMQMIQKGFLYNNEGIIEEGVKQFKIGLEHEDAFVIAAGAKEDDKTFDPKSYAKTEPKALNGLADDILNNFKSGDRDKASEAYTKTLNRCLACHKIIRKW